MYCMIAGANGCMVLIAGANGCIVLIAGANGCIVLIAGANGCMVWYGMVWYCMALVSGTHTFAPSHALPTNTTIPLMPSSAFQVAESGGGGRSPSNARAPISGQFESKATDGPKYHEDPQFGKYFKMTKIGTVLYCTVLYRAVPCCAVPCAWVGSFYY
jgi:hypothetical protein